MCCADATPPPRASPPRRKTRQGKVRTPSSSTQCHQIPVREVQLTQNPPNPSRIEKMTTLCPDPTLSLWSVILPIPPSQNKLWIPVAIRGRSRLVTSPEYKVWRNSLNLVEFKTAPIFLEPVAVVIDLIPGKDLCQNSDLDNFFKAPIDALVRHGILVDDSIKYIHHVQSTLRPSTDNRGQGVMEINIYHSFMWTGQNIQQRYLFDREIGSLDENIQ